ncbi:MAG TPA: hypothetical protein PLK10_09585, partial [Ottowia sp.]|nr:hypothetical protein [Ottowia sp.]
NLEPGFSLDHCSMFPNLHPARQNAPDQSWARRLLPAGTQTLNADLCKKHLVGLKFLRPAMGEALDYGRLQKASQASRQAGALA